MFMFMHAVFVFVLSFEMSHKTTVNTYILVTLNAHECGRWLGYLWTYTHIFAWFVVAGGVIFMQEEHCYVETTITFWNSRWTYC